MGDTTALPNGQKVAVGSTGLTVAKLLAAKAILDANEVPDSERYLALNSAMLSTMLGATETTSIDFNTVKSLVNGQIDQFLGFKFIRTEKIVTTGTLATEAVAWHKGSIGVAIARERNSIWQRNDKHGLWEAYGSVHFGATRTDDKGVVQIAVA
jgi:hypothetical protein